MNNLTYWKKFEDTDMVYVSFKEKGYYYTKPYACAPSEFHKTVIFHNGEKYHIIWQLVNDQWEITLVARKDKTIFVPMGSAVIDDISIVEQKCKDYYKQEKCVPLRTYSV